MGDPLQPLVLLIGIQLDDVMMDEVVLDEPAEVLLVARCRGDQELP